MYDPPIAETGVTEILLRRLVSNTSCVPLHNLSMYVSVTVMFHVCLQSLIAGRVCVCTPGSSVKDQTAEWKAPAAPQRSEEPAAVLHQHPSTLLPL